MRTLLLPLALCFGLLSPTAHAFSPGEIWHKWQQHRQEKKAKEDAVWNQPQPPAGSVPQSSPSTGPVGQGKGFEACAQEFPYATPMAYPTGTWHQARAICFDSFAVLHSGATKTPVVTIERLNNARLQNTQERTNQFYAEARLPMKERAQLEDYKGSGYDRGHMAPAADMPNPNAMAQSFSLANMVPQDPVNNRKIWSKIESDVRKFAKRAQGDTFVFTGPIYQQRPAKTIGYGKVWVPEYLFKLVFNPTEKKAYAFILPNTADAKIGAPMSYADFVARTKFPVLDTWVKSQNPGQKTGP